MINHFFNKERFLGVLNLYDSLFFYSFKKKNRLRQKDILNQHECIIGSMNDEYDTYREITRTYLVDLKNMLRC